MGEVGWGGGVVGLRIWVQERRRGEKMRVGCRETGARVGKAVGEVGGGRWRRREARRGSG